MGWSRDLCSKSYVYANLSVLPIHIFCNRSSKKRSIRSVRSNIQIEPPPPPSQEKITSLNISTYCLVFIVDLIPRPLPRENILHALRKLARHLIHPRQMQERQL